ncbi:MAG: chromate resistance protein ChrB domain-containing protein [Chloroflexota bacterium]
MKFVTRERIGVERVAVPWLLRKFVDAKAEFIFVPADKVIEVAKREGAISFDAHGTGDIDHKDNRCSFESAVEKYKITDPAILEMAKLVHAADIPADINLVPEAPGFLAVIRGFQQLYSDDNDRLRTQFPVYDALYAYYKSRLAKKA